MARFPVGIDRLAHLVQEGMLMYPEIERTPRLLLWSCRVVLRILEHIAWKFKPCCSEGLKREFLDVLKELDEAIWPDGKPPKVYEG